MKRIIIFFSVALLILSSIFGISYAARRITGEDVRKTVRQYINAKQAGRAFIPVYDPVWGRNRRVTFYNFRKAVNKAKDFYYVTVDFRDLDNNELLAVDYDVKDVDGKLKVIGTKIRAVGGKQRFRFNNKGERVYLQGRPPQKEDLTE